VKNSLKFEEKIYN